MMTLVAKTPTKEIALGDSPFDFMDEAFDLPGNSVEVIKDGVSLGTFTKDEAIALLAKQVL
jgi:hypothetical protein